MVIDGHKLRQIREGKLLTRQQVADRGEVNIQTVMRAELYDRVSMRGLDSICRALSIKPGEVLLDPPFTSGSRAERESLRGA